MKNQLTFMECRLRELSNSPGDSPLKNNNDVEKCHEDDYEVSRYAL